MRKVLLCAVFLALGGPAFAAVGSPLEWSVQGGGVFPMHDTQRLDNTGYAATRLTFDLTPYLAVGAEADLFRFNDKTSAGKGRLWSVPVLAEVELKAPVAAVRHAVIPYVYAGAGVNFWDYKEGGTMKDNDIDLKNRDHFAAKGGVGVDYYLTNHVALFVEGSYLYTVYDPKTNSNGTSFSGKIRPEAILGGGGIKIAF